MNPALVQPVGRALAEKLGAGVALPGDASGAAIRAVAAPILADSGFAASAAECAAVLSRLARAPRAADEIEAMSRQPAV